MRAEYMKFLAVALEAAALFVVISSHDPMHIALEICATCAAHIEDATKAYVWLRAYWKRPIKD